MKRPGPELKMPKLNASDLKVPPVVADLYWDLHDRHLLPLVALAVVAIVAVPFLLGGGSSESPPPAPGAATVEVVHPPSLTVVRAEPGLRDYHKRLGRRKPVDPFKQKFTGSVLKGATLKSQPKVPASTNKTASNTTPSTTTGSGSGSGSGSTPPSSGNGGGGSPGGTGTTKKPHLTFFAFGINVRITRSGGKNAESKDSKEKQEPIVKHDVLPQTPLPGEKAPVVTYMGLARKGKKPTGKVLMMVSNEVKSIFGETHCVSGDEVCQLIEVEPGFPVTFVYGANEVHYTVNVLKVTLVVTGHS